MWWKLTGLAALAAGFTALMFWPVSVDIRVDLPPPASAAPISPETMLTVIEISAYVITFALFAGVFGLIGWLMWRVVRHHRAVKNRQA